MGVGEDLVNVGVAGFFGGFIFGVEDGDRSMRGAIVDSEINAVGMGGFIGRVEAVIGAIATIRSRERNEGNGAIGGVHCADDIDVFRDAEAAIAPWG